MNRGRMADPALLILCYHAVSESWPSVVAVTPQALDRQVRRALRRGYRPATLAAALREPLGSRSLVVSFDDAFRSVLSSGLPVLERHGVPATLFVPTDFAAAGAPMTWSVLERWVGTEHERELLCMRWPEIARLAEAGWEIGSHTCSHPDLTELDPAAVERELRDSRAACEGELGRPCTTLAYPYGAHDPTVVQSARDAGYELAVTLGERLLEPIATVDPLLLPRDGVYRSTGRLHFELAVAPQARRLRAMQAFARL